MVNIFWKVNLLWNLLQIRRQAIKDLPQLCKDTKEHTPKIGDTLAQLLILEDPTELQQVNMSLQAILKVGWHWLKNLISIIILCFSWQFDPKGALTGIFSQITSGDEATREKCFKFLATKLFALGPEVITKEVEDFIIEKIKNVLQVTMKRFV